ncbi:MAG: hypothetical protein ACK4OP_00205 [Gemmobacter sp.]
MSTEYLRIDLPKGGEQDRAIQRVAEATHRLNESVQRAVAAGVTVEIVRVARHHDGAGHWGDQVVPTVRNTTKDAPDAS